LEAVILAEDPTTVAAFIMEPVMGEFGVVAPPEDYYRVVAETCRRYGVLFIVDEVTTGFGRTGKLFVSQDWPLQPDILCLGKAISGGYLPLAATLTTEAVFQRFLGKGRTFIHGSTNSGHPVCAAVGLAAIDIILREKLPENAAKIGAYLKSRLLDLMNTHPIIGEVRGSGLMIAIDLTKDRNTKEPFTNDEIYAFWLDATSRGLLLSFNDWGLSLFPPLITDEGTADGIVQIMDDTLHTGAKAEIERKARLVREFALSKS
jgi:adenosylmethionine-8-amino-7-oxononanoate aminotransferase